MRKTNHPEKTVPKKDNDLVSGNYLSARSMQDRTLLDRMIADRDTRRLLIEELRRPRPGVFETAVIHLGAALRVAPVRVAAIALAASALLLVIFPPSRSELRPISVVLAPETAASLRPMGANDTTVALDEQAMRGLLALPEHRGSGIGFGFDKPGKMPVYRIGEFMRIAVSARSDNQVIVLKVDSLSTPTLLYLGSAGVGHPVPLTVVLPANGNYPVVGPAGDYRIRIVVLPRGVAIDGVLKGSGATGVTIWDVPYRVFTP
jgi:hypothetical protein